MDKKKILLVEDNKELNDGNRRVLEGEGYEVESALTIAEARKRLSCFFPDVILLDIMMPDGDGTEFCVEIRNITDAHIIFLTSCREHEEKLRGLAVGGDDYITKPFKIDEMLYRVVAAMRRRDMSKVPVQIITKGKLVLDIIARRAYIDGMDLSLKSVEYGLLLFFVQNEGRLMNTSTIYQKVWGQPMSKDKNALQKAVSDLRKKIEPSGYTINNVYGKGQYVMELY